MPFKECDEPSGPWRDQYGLEWPAAHAWRWDAEAARLTGHWSSNADMLRGAWLELAEQLIARGAIARVWDALADRSRLPKALRPADERRIIRAALRRAAELGQIDPAMVAVLVHHLPGSDRALGENKKQEEHQAIRAELMADPSLSDRKLAEKYNVARSTVADIRLDLAQPEE